MFHDELQSDALSARYVMLVEMSMPTPQEDLMSESELRRARRSNLAVGDMQLSLQLYASVSAELALVALQHD